jgi:hypothetical protein
MKKTFKITNINNLKLVTYMNFARGIKFLGFHSTLRKNLWGVRARFLMRGHLSGIYKNSEYFSGEIRRLSFITSAISHPEEIFGTPEHSENPIGFFYSTMPRTSKIKNINYLWRITYGYQDLWGVRLGSVRLG